MANCINNCRFFEAFSQSITVKFLFNLLLTIPAVMNKGNKLLSKHSNKQTIIRQDYLAGFNNKMKLKHIL
jgi:hypothetical protein